MILLFNVFCGNMFVFIQFLAHILEHFIFRTANSMLATCCGAMLVLQYVFTVSVFGMMLLSVFVSFDKESMAPLKCRGHGNIPPE